jgi:hypothetical protein
MRSFAIATSAAVPFLCESDNAPDRGGSAYTLLKYAAMPAAPCGVWLIFVLLLFAALFLEKGLRYEPAKDVEMTKAASAEVLTYWHYAPAWKTWLVKSRAEEGLVGTVCSPLSRLSRSRRNRCMNRLIGQGVV